MPDPTVTLWARVKELEEEQRLHNISIDAATARFERAEAEVKRLRGFAEKIVASNADSTPEGDYLDFWMEDPATGKRLRVPGVVYEVIVKLTEEAQKLLKEDSDAN